MFNIFVHMCALVLCFWAIQGAYYYLRPRCVALAGTAQFRVFLRTFAKLLLFAAVWYILHYHTLFLVLCIYTLFNP